MIISYFSSTFRLLFSDNIKQNFIDTSCAVILSTLICHNYICHAYLILIRIRLYPRHSDVCITRTQNAVLMDYPDCYNYTCQFTQYRCILYTVREIDYAEISTGLQKRT